MSGINYKEAAVSGSQYRRCSDVSIRNPLNGAKSIRMMEEDVVVLPEGTVRKPVDELRTVLDESNALTPFDLLNPADNSVVGSMTYQEVYGVMYSLYMHMALARDAAASPD